MAEQLKGVYRPRNPRATALYQILEDYFETFTSVYDDRYQQSHGYWRPVIAEVVNRYLDCGVLNNGFARIRCPDCRDELLLTLSCKAKAFCPSCAAKRRAELSARLLDDILVPVPHSLWTFTIPKRLRPWFKFDRNLLGKLCLCAWKSLRAALEEIVDVGDAMAGAVAGIHSAGKLVNSNPHVHILCTDGLLDSEGTFFSAPPWIDFDAIAKLFRHQVFSLLLKAEKISPLIVENMMSWPHSGFHVHRADPIDPKDREAVERVVGYLVQCPISLENLSYREENDEVVYRAGRKGPEQRTFSPLDFIAELCMHIPDKGKHNTRMYGIYSNAHRGAINRQARAQCPPEPTAIEEPPLSTRAYRQKWAELIQRVFEVDPLICSKCGGRMEIIAFITEADPIRKILVHLDLWDAPIRPPPPRLPPPEPIVDLDHSQLTFDDIPTIEYVD